MIHKETMPRFVILEHDHPDLHWDLMLEAGDILQTWRLAQAPDGSQPIDATALGDHRVVYLDYEGPVSGNRGTVKRWDAGSFTDDADSTAERRRLLMHGKRVHGSVVLERWKGEMWRFRPA
jgi:DNA polymerase Ligase (LigD)